MSSRQRRQVEQIDRHIAELHKLKLLVGQAWHACELTLPDGYGSGGSEPVSGGDTSRPTEGAYLAIEGRLESREDATGDEARRIGMASVETSLRVIARALTEAHAELTVLIAPLVRRDPPARSNIVDCQACTRSVANTPGDRLRSGYCRACRKAWERQGRPDRVQFERNRAKHGGDRVHIGTRDDGTNQSIELTFAGRTIRLPAHLAAEFTALGADDQVLELRRYHEAATDWWEAQA